MANEPSAPESETQSPIIQPTDTISTRIKNLSELTKPVDFNSIREGVDLDMATGGLEPGKSVDELEEAARTDAVTGLPNRRALEDHLNDEEATRERLRHDKHPVPKGTYLALDLSGLHNTNKAYGESAGDEYLRAVTRSILRSIRIDDKVFRLGDKSDEFSIDLKDNADEQSILKIIDRINKDIEDENKIIQQQNPSYEGIHFSVSPVAVRYGETLSPREANAKAHDLMGAAKQKNEEQTGVRGGKIDRIII